MNLKKLIIAATLAVGVFGASTAFAVRPPPPAHVVQTDWYACRADSATCIQQGNTDTENGQDWCYEQTWSDGGKTYGGYCYD